MNTKEEESRAAQHAREREEGGGVYRERGGIGAAVRSRGVTRTVWLCCSSDGVGEHGVDSGIVASHSDLEGDAVLGIE